MVRSGLASVVLVVLMATACGGTQTQPKASQEPEKPLWEPPPLPTDGAIAALGLTPPEDKPWTSMSYEEKEWYMIGKVHPIMRQIFMTYDEKKYEGLGMECVQCHGEDAKEKQYKMPSAHLSPVPPYDSEDFKAMYPSRIVQFMVKRVTPAMGQLIDAPDFNPKTGEGFSCYGCHPKG